MFKSFRSTLVFIILTASIFPVILVSSLLAGKIYGITRESAMVPPAAVMNAAAVANSIAICMPGPITGAAAPTAAAALPILRPFTA